MRLNLIGYFESGGAASAENSLTFGWIFGKLEQFTRTYTLTFESFLTHTGNASLV